MPVQLPRTLQQGCATTLVALLDPSIQGNVIAMPTKTSYKLTYFDDPESSPAFLYECQITDVWDYATDERSAEALWKMSEHLLGQKFDL